AIEVLRVGSLESRHRARERHLPHFEPEMDVVVHEAIGPDGEPELLPVMLQAPQVELAVRVVAKNRFSLIPPRHDVVERPGKLDPKRARHGPIIPQVMTDPEARRPWRGRRRPSGACRGNRGRPSSLRSGSFSW